MTQYNFNNKKFVLLENSESGAADSGTIFEYQQEGSFVTGNYQGGSIKYGKIIANLKGDRLEMLYQCLTIENQLKAGKAIADISLTNDNKLKLSLKWQWLTDHQEKGISEYIEY